jgi:hypothetical protein
VTIDSPRGAESVPTYQPGARDRVARWYRDQWGYRVNNEATLKHADDALEAVQPEVERLTAEVERLQQELGTIRGELADFAQESVPSHVPTLQAVRWLIAEHDEQVKHNEEIGKENRALCNERDEWKRAAEAETQGRQVEVSRLREQLATLTARHEATLRTESFEIDDIVCWRGDRWFEGRIVCETAEEDKILDTEVWDLEVTDPGTMYVGVDMTGRPVHVSPDCLVLVERPTPVSEPAPASSQRFDNPSARVSAVEGKPHDGGLLVEWEPLRASASSEASPVGVCTAEHPEFGRCFIDASEHTSPGGQDYHESEEGSWPCESTDSSPPSGGDSDATPRQFDPHFKFDCPDMRWCSLHGSEAVSSPGQEEK